MGFKKSEILKTSILALIVGALLWVPSGFPQSSNFKNFNWGAFKRGGGSRMNRGRGFNNFNNRNKIVDVAADLEDLLDANATLKPFATLVGMVWGEDGKPAKGITVTIERQDSKGSYHVNSDEKGKYTYDGLPAGEYVLGVIYKGDAGLLREATLRVGRQVESIFDLKDWAPMGKAGFDKDKLLLTEQTEPEVGVKLTPDDQVKFDKAKELAGNGDHQGAIKLLKELIAKFPTEAVFWGRLGDSYLMLKQYDDAVAAYRTAVELKPEVPNYNGNLAMALLFSDKIDEATVYTEKTAALDKGQGAQAYYNLGLALTDKGDGPKAEGAFEKSTKLDGGATNAESYYQLGLTLLTTHQIPPLKVTDAIAPLETYQKLASNAPPEDTQTRENLQAAKDIIAVISQPAAKAAAPANGKPAAPASNAKTPAPASNAKAPATTGGKK